MVLAQHNCGGCQLVKGVAALCTCRKEYNKYDLTATQCFWLAHHNDWLRWFAISTPPPIWCPSFGFMGGVAKEYITKLGCEKHFRRSHTEHRWRCSKNQIRALCEFRSCSYFICLLNWCWMGFIYPFISISIRSFWYCNSTFFCCSLFIVCLIFYGVVKKVTKTFVLACVYTCVMIGRHYKRSTQLKHSF